MLSQALLNRTIPKWERRTVQINSFGTTLLQACPLHAYPWSSLSRWKKQTDFSLYSSPGLRLGLITPLDLDETQAHPLLLIMYEISFFAYSLFSNVKQSVTA